MGEFDLSLISEFRSRPSFYDRSSPRFKDKLYNAHQWQEISNKLGFDVSILKDRILQLRNRYNLEKRRIEQLREENPNKYYESPWPLYDHLHFLSDHIRARRSYRKMMPLNGSGGGGGGGGMAGGEGMGHFAAGPELSNSCSNNSNLTLRHVTDSGGGESKGPNMTAAFPNGLLAVKMEDDSEETEPESESQNNDSEINAFETSGLIPQTQHSTSLPNHILQQQQQHSALKQQQQLLQQHLQQRKLHPTISIRRLDSLRHNVADSSSSLQNNNIQKQQRQQQQQRNHLTSSHNRSSMPYDDESAASTALTKKPRLNARELKYSAFGNFISSSLLELPPSTALELVEQFTSDIVKVLMANAQQKQQQQYRHDMEN